MIKTESTADLQGYLQKCCENCTGLGELDDYEVKLHVDEKVKPFKFPPRFIPCHLKERA